MGRLGATTAIAVGMLLGCTRGGGAAAHTDDRFLDAATRVDAESDAARPNDATEAGAAEDASGESHDAALDGSDGVADTFDAGDPARVCGDSLPIRGRSVGHTSVVFKLELANGQRIAFKPKSRRGGARYKGEIAAHRLAQALGLPNVLPACARTLPSGALHGALDAIAPARALLDGEVVADADGVRGAAIPWLATYTVFPLEQEPLRRELTGYLRRGATVPPARANLARQTSILLAFDFLTANWDRWSGANVAIDAPTETLLFVDNDGAFFAQPPADALAQNQRRLEAMTRFSRSFVEALRRAEDLAVVFGDEGPGVPLLAPGVIAAVGERRRQLLARIDALATAGPDAATTDGGAEDPLFFP